MAWYGMQGILTFGQCQECSLVCAPYGVLIFTVFHCIWHPVRVSSGQMIGITAVHLVINLHIK